MLLLGFALAALIGLSLGLLGGGGSILTVPIFVYVIGIEVKPAIAMSLPVVGATSLVGAARHWRDGNIALRTALAFGLVTMAGSSLGAWASRFVSDAAQLSLLAIVMVVAALAMLRRTVAGSIEGPSGPDLGEHARRATRQQAPLVGVAAAALGVGLLTGLAGIGGGFLIVPALVLLLRLPMKRAVGTSLVVIAMSCAAAAARYAHMVSIDWAFVGLFTVGAVAGILAGTRLVRHVSQHTLRRTFALFLLIMATLMLYQNRAVWRGNTSRAAG